MPLVDPTRANADPSQVPVVVDDNATASAVADLGGRVLVGVHLPTIVPDPNTVGLAGGVTAAAVTKTVTDLAGDAVAVPVVSNGYVPFDPVVTLGLRFVKLTFGSAVTNGPQTFVLATRKP